MVCIFVKIRHSHITCFCIFFNALITRQRYLESITVESIMSSNIQGFLGKVCWNRNWTWAHGMGMAQCSPSRHEHKTLHTKFLIFLPLHCLLAIIFIHHSTYVINLTLLLSNTMKIHESCTFLKKNILFTGVFPVSRANSWIQQALNQHLA